MSEFEMLVMTALACLGMGMLVVGPAVVHLPSIRKKRHGWHFNAWGLPEKSQELNAKRMIFFVIHTHRYKFQIFLN